VLPPQDAGLSDLAAISWRQIIVQPGFGGCHGLIPLSRDSVLVSDTYQRTRSVYSVNTSTGALGSYLGLQFSQPTGMVFSPDKRFIYTCDIAAGVIHMHGTGNRSLQTRLRVTGSPWNARYDVAGNALYYVTFQGQVRRLSARGDTQVGGDVPGPYDLVLLSNGQVVVSSMSGSSLYRIDVRSGQTTRFASFGQGSIPEGLDVFVDSDGREKLIVADTGLGKVYQVDPTSGATTTLLDGSNQPRFRLPINVRTLGKQVFVNAMGPSGEMLLLVGDLI